VAKKSKKSKKSRQDIQQEVMDSAHQVWLAGLGALSKAQDRGGEFFRQLVERGKELEGRGRDKVEEVVDQAKERLAGRGEGVGEALDERISAVLHRVGVPTRDEIQQLTKRVEELNKKVSGLRGAEPAAAKPAAKKPAARKAAAKRPAAKKASAKKPAAKKATAKKPATKKASSAKGGDASGDQGA
jgi:poly(hydroxyalkanoate) granule-associated protein